MSTKIVAYIATGSGARDNDLRKSNGGGKLKEKIYIYILKGYLK